MDPSTRPSLIWQSRSNVFLGVVLSGHTMLALLAYLVYQHPKTTLLPIELLSYAGLASFILIMFAAAWSYFSQQRLVTALTQVQQIADSLPLLSAKKYTNATELYQQLAQTPQHEEVFTLQQATTQLCRALDKLDGSVQQRTALINDKNLALQGERDFIKSLLNTAQLIILTIDESFEITLFNEHAVKVTGYSAAEVIGTEVARMFPSGHWTEAKMRFKELLNGHLHVTEQDSELIDKQGLIKYISWLHSRLDNNDTATILLVGLDMTDKREAEQRLVWMAEHDPLTNLCNRRKFIEEFEKSLRTAIRYQHNNTLLYLDLDQFKDINDTSGHRAGDELLKLVAKTLKNVVRFTDLVARLGGDEFAILMPENDNAGGKVLANKILQELSAIHLEYGNVKHKITASMGIVHYPLHNASIHELMSFADLAMYKSKSTGKGRFHTFSPDDQTRENLENRVFWKHQIEDALENDHFILHYQPILELKTNKVDHYEVLIRMNDPVSGTIRMPGKFIEIAEQVSLIQAIDEQVIEMGLRKLASLQQSGTGIRLAINLSAATIDSPTLTPLLKRLFMQYQVDPSGVIFEVTETVAVSNLQHAKKMMHSIKALGCQFSLDDFGVGFSSFNYIRELPVDIIKIDGIFIKDLNKNAADQLFVKALVDVAKGLGRKTVAEFVEDLDVLLLLRTYGVDFAQGYYIGRPAAEVLANKDWRPVTFDS